MSYISMKNLLEAGVHFGHQTKRWNPKMSKYVFGKRNGIYIVDLQKTVQCFNQAYEFVRDSTKNGAKTLFVGTKKQAQEAVKTSAEKCGSFYVNNRWLGGTMTNFATIYSRVQRMKELEEMFNSGFINRFKKKEIASLNREYEKLYKNLAGIKEMEKLPDLIFIIDIKREMNAVNEARNLGIPIVAIVDTNCDPDLVDFPIPGNDDAIRACQLISDRMANAINEGKQLREDELVQEVQERQQTDEEAGLTEEAEDVPVDEIVNESESGEEAEEKEEKTGEEEK
ncbi:ribosomal protein S2 [Flexistipes sinusarabici DSM 4947]|uniref:Small ribosomal subunit protein uS2 n=1 Tax=Flexistipes sinusarabici (strain ATCC 49648 / DSM 4947 / MAS 10) TaxID=717231 RepID=F8E988_FLESM|nr:30S ribosomal protein S2 [Flexistipes sinusarabici]AEI15290.1 ribosomal protein S2 [Flexistipes sinusarabici DSM 4947]